MAKNKNRKPKKSQAKQPVAALIPASVSTENAIVIKPGQQDDLVRSVISIDKDDVLALLTSQAQQTLRRQQAELLQQQTEQSQKIAAAEGETREVVEDVTRSVIDRLHLAWAAAAGKLEGSSGLVTSPDYPRQIGQLVSINSKGKETTALEVTLELQHVTAVPDSPGTTELRFSHTKIVELPKSYFDSVAKVHALREEKDKITQQLEVVRKKLQSMPELREVFRGRLAAGKLRSAAGGEALLNSMTSQLEEVLDDLVL